MTHEAFKVYKLKKADLSKISSMKTLQNALLFLISFVFLKETGALA